MIGEKETRGWGARRTFSRLVNGPVLEAYSLRYAPRSFRTWGEYSVATTLPNGVSA